MKLAWPLPPECNRITQIFGARPDFYREFGLAGHEGLDIACDPGTRVLAAHDGIATAAWGPIYGDQMRVRGEKILTLYAHLLATLVGQNQRVKAGDTLGLSGNTGRSEGPHLHLGVQEDGVPNPPFKGWLDPLPYLRRRAMTKTSAFIQRIEPWMQQALLDLGTNWVKLVNPPPGSDPMPRIPNKLVRMHTDAIDAQYLTRAETGGGDFVRHMLPAWRDRAWATCYSLACGPNSDEIGDLQNLRGYSMGAMAEAEAHGIKLAILDLFESHPTGGDPYNPEVKRAKLQELLPAAQLAVELGHYVALQAYWRPGVEGPLGYHHALGDLILKVQMWGEMGLDLSRLRLFGSEWGLDGAVGGNPYEGWRAFVARGEISEQDYINGLLAGEALAREYPWLVALFKFVYGWEKPWQTYDHDEGFVRNLVAAMGSVPGPPVEPIGPPTAGKLTDAEKARLHEFFGTAVPATLKDALKRGRIFVGEVPGSPNLYVSWSQAQQFEINKIAMGTWEHLDDEPM